MGIDWWQVFALSAMAVIAGFFILLFLSYQWTKKQPQEDAEPRIPEIGDEYLILDHVWRVRSREVIVYGTKESQKMRHKMYLETIPSEVPYDGAMHKSFYPDQLTEYQFLGNPKKEAATVSQTVGELAIKQGIPSEEIRVALEKQGGWDIDQSTIRSTENIHGDPPPLDLANLPGLTEEGRARLKKSRDRTYTGHAETDEGPNKEEE